jgi:hypothetical protein
MSELLINGHVLKLVKNGDGTESFTVADTCGGVATSGSATTLADTSKNFDTDVVKSKVVAVEIDGVNYYRTIISHTADTLTFVTLPTDVVVAAGCVYRILI